MKNSLRLPKLGSFFLALVLMASCSSDDDASTSSPGSEVIVEEAKLKDFPLFNIQRTNIEIVDPEIVDNKEVTYGQINITVPAETSLAEISALITSDELNLSKFSITPGNDTKVSYVDGATNMYTITNATDSQEELLHYNVNITREAPVTPEVLKLTGFTFEKSKNPSLPNDITISRTIEDTGIDKIYLFVPVGTDFSQLVPTITYNGSALHYFEGPSRSTTEKVYQANTAMDFKYPSTITLEIKNQNDDESKLISVIVDVINPIKIETISVTTPDTKEGTSETYVVTQWTNQGNHLLEYGQADTQENQEPVTPTNVIRATRTFPSIGLVPGDSADIRVSVRAQDYSEGTYKTTTVFYPRIKYNSDIDELLEPAKLNVTAKIIK